ncbi:hypothetical protein SHKM778_76060 [Streptomyces sp. KM77-8]|uniref:Beta-galactosidase jelly roll domain-containing protein n=1 Tax=Streptomyces haneummycinicus TaxID=3074435 RepID=A0AAT9HUM2_9ACTN
MAWLDGRPLGSHRMPAPEKGGGTRKATAVFEVPGKRRGRGGHVLSVLVRPMGHDGDVRAEGTHKAARGLIAVGFGAAPRASSGASRAPRHRTGCADRSTTAACTANGTAGICPASTTATGGRWSSPPGAAAGVAWYRTEFRLDVPADVDASIGLTLDDDPERAYRAQIFLNGWNMGQYLNDVGPRHTFVLPNGILRTRGANTLALAVLADGTTLSGPREVRLTLLGAARGGIPVKAVDSPGRVSPPPVGYASRITFQDSGSSTAPSRPFSSVVPSTGCGRPGRARRGCCGRRGRRPRGRCARRPRSAADHSGRPPAEGPRCASG